MKNKIFHPDFKTICNLFNKHQVEYLVIGGWAGIIYGLPRTTRDIDIYIRKTKENCQRLIEVLEQVGAGIAQELTPEDILSRKIFMFADQIKIDIFTETYGIKNYDEVSRRKNIVNFEGIKIPVVSFADFIKTKKTDRIQDKEDLKILMEIRKGKK